MVEFSWLHLTDLHVGMEGSEHLWPSVEDEFYKDLRWLLIDEQLGPLDMVLFTGDFVQRGGRSEFERVDTMLEKLWKQFRAWGSDPPFLLAVPGNHDLVRPVNTVENPNPALDTLRYLWEEKKRIRNAFWNNRDSPQRQVVNEAFSNYVEWYRSVAMPKPETYVEGMLPGDFSATIEKDGHKLGVVGLNSTFLQLTDQEFKGELEVNLRQFNSVCRGHGSNWTNEHRVCLLLTHHPPEWLREEAQDHLAQIHDPPQRFALHLYGHLHDPNLRQTAEGGADPRNRTQGVSLFGLENWDDKQERVHGYSFGKLTIDDGNDEPTGTLRIWPRKATKKQSGGWEIGRDDSYSLPRGQDAIGPMPIKLLPQHPAEDPPPQVRDWELRDFSELEPTVDPILVARLDALQRKLTRIPEWLQSDLEFLEAEQHSKRKLEGDVGRAVRKRIIALNSIYTHLDKVDPNNQAAVDATVDKAWSKYSALNGESQEIFRECLELLGGLALRHKKLDDNICWLADEVVSESAFDYLGTMYPSFTVLAQQEALNKTMARIVRLRFPEWTVWSLPFTAHEFGHVVIDEDTEGLRSFVDAKSEAWNKYHVYEIVADTFATYMMGPAYVCAATSLRLDPLSVSDEVHLADTTRAHVIFTVLEWMNTEARDHAGKSLAPYSELIEQLRRQWQTVLRRTGYSTEPWLGVWGTNADSTMPEDGLTDLAMPKVELTNLVLDTLTELREVFRENGRYPPAGDTGFEVAAQWAQDWSKQLDQWPTRKRLSLPRIPRGSTLRDALNAAWLCRMNRYPHDVDVIDNAAYRLCERIIEHREPSTDYGSGTGEIYSKQLPRR